MVLDNTTNNLLVWISSTSVVFLSVFAGQLYSIIQNSGYVKLTLAAVVAAFFLWSFIYSPIMAMILWLGYRLDPLKRDTEGLAERKPFTSGATALMMAISLLLMYVILTAAPIMMDDYWEISQFTAWERLLSIITLLVILYTATAQFQLLNVS